MAPLDWGLGHATRCIPIVRALLQNNIQVILAAEGAQAALLKQEFPQLTCLPLTGYRVRYSRSRWLLPLKLLIQLPRLLATIRSEHDWLDVVIDQYQIDLVIADNRYGLNTKKIPCVFITHQLTIKAPSAWLEKRLQKINYRYINRFTACWVPDAAGKENAAGLLSHPANMPKTKVSYIGLLARFQKQPSATQFEYCILLSGPEPQRTLLENKILSGLSQVEGRILLVRGKPGSDEILKVPPHVTVKNHLPGNELGLALMQSEYIVSRSGYTTIMELLSLQKKAILIPTPGQTEQEYLAETLQQKQLSFTITQQQFNCQVHLEKAKQFGYISVELPLFMPVDIITLLNSIR